jgi:hypothetical protein
LLSDAHSLFRDDDFVWTDVGALAAPLCSVRGVISRTAIDNDGEARSAPKRDREQIEQLGVPARHHDPIAGHSV